MSRSADYTILGFLYQFNKTVLEILRARDDDTITVEGVLEDVEVVTATSTTAIQCKYHEGSTRFTPSAVYKPLLQMLHHFDNNSRTNIRYVLFAHFPSDDGAVPRVGRHECQAALDSRNKDLQKYTASISPSVDVDGFLRRFHMEIGPTYDDLTGHVHAALKSCRFPPHEIETLAYPNAIHLIATLAIRHDVASRRITKRCFLNRLNGIRTTIISRWTMALQTRSKLLETRRKHLKVQLDKNSRRRYFVIDPISFADYEREIVRFIADYLDKYHYKLAHIHTPVFCICASLTAVRDVHYRLYKRGVIATDGYIGGHFERDYFFRDPITVPRPGNTGVVREFALRITNWDDHGQVLNMRPCDDLFILGDIECDSLIMEDLNVERIAGATLKEIKFLIGVSNVAN